MFIYEIVNVVDGKRIIGQTTQKYAGRRWSDHRRKLSLGKHHNPHLQHAWNKHGFNSFKFSVIESDVNSIEDLNELEIFYIERYNTLDRRYGYNLREGGRNGKLSEESKKKMKGRPAWNKGRKWTKEERKNISVGLLGKKFSVEEQDKRAIAGKTSPYILKSPFGKIIEVINLSRFCRENGLNRNCIYDMRHRPHKQRSHKGWTNVNT